MEIGILKPLLFWLLLVQIVSSGFLPLTNHEITWYHNGDAFVYNTYLTPYIAQELDKYAEENEVRFYNRIELSEETYYVPTVDPSNLPKCGKITGTGESVDLTRPKSRCGFEVRRRYLYVDPENLPMLRVDDYSLGVTFQRFGHVIHTPTFRSSHKLNREEGYQCTGGDPSSCSQPGSQFEGLSIEHRGSIAGCSNTEHPVLTASEIMFEHTKRSASGSCIATKVENLIDISSGQNSVCSFSMRQSSTASTERSEVLGNTEYNSIESTVSITTEASAEILAVASFSSSLTVSLSSSYSKTQTAESSQGQSDEISETVEMGIETTDGILCLERITETCPIVVDSDVHLYGAYCDDDDDFKSMYYSSGSVTSYVIRTRIESCYQ